MPMLIDENENPISSKRKRWLSRLSDLKSVVRGKVAWTLTALGTLAIVLANLTNILDFYERVTDGPEISIPISVHNPSKKPVTISQLLDIHITATQFYSGRLIGGELPTSRVRLIPDDGDYKNSYTIQPGEIEKYNINIPERPYKQRLASGGSTIVFVLQIEDSNEMLYFTKPFYRDVLRSIQFQYTIE